MTTGEIVEQSKEYIKKNIERSLTVAEIAGAVGYSEYYFSRLFKNETRTSVMEYVKREKLQKASVEIRSGKKIMDTALKYGWEYYIMGLRRLLKRNLAIALLYFVLW